MLVSRKYGEENVVKKQEKTFLKRTDLVLRAFDVSHETHDGNREDEFTFM